MMSTSEGFFKGTAIRSAIIVKCQRPAVANDALPILSTEVGSKNRNILENRGRFYKFIFGKGGFSMF